MKEDDLNLDSAIGKIDRIISELDQAFERGSIDFDLVDSELKALKGELETIKNMPDRGFPEEIISSPKDRDAEFILREPVCLENFR